MNKPAAVSAAEVPTFSECVLGYRAWAIDDQDRLWPISDRRVPWEPGINTARCNCAVPGTLSFDWSWHDGRRVLEPHPRHDAPTADCVCGLYSWRRPRQSWKHDQPFVSGTRVFGAVASWGQLQVHHTGFRAEHACVVTLAYPPGIGTEAMHKLERVATRYRVELVALEGLEDAASRHGSPLPDSMQPEDDREPPLPNPPRAPLAGIDRDREPASESRRSPEPGLEPIPTRDRIAITLIFLSGALLACGSRLWLGRGSAAWVGVSLVIAGFIGIMLTTWWLEPRKAAKHAGHRVIHHARNARQRRAQGGRKRAQPTMTDAEFDAVEDALEPLYEHGNRMDNAHDPIHP